MIYFIADTHFNDDRIIRYENRPFNNRHEMRQKLIENWNSVVGKSDTIYHLGDVGHLDSDSFKQLNGRICLIKGNHDMEPNSVYYNMGFAEVYDYPIILDEFWMLSHKPLYVSTSMPYANIFGHVHNSPYIKTFSQQHYCVSAERINYTPISFDVIKITMTQSI